MGLTTTCDDDGKVKVEYDLKWVQSLLAASCCSMVAYSWFSSEKSGLTDHRSYPRSTESTFTLGTLQTTDPKSGGRPHKDDLNLVPMGKLLASKERVIPLSDVAILTKRALASRALAVKLTHLQTAGGVLSKEFVPDFGAHGYPMLCVLGASKTEGFPDPKSQAHWRVVQSVFCAVLTKQLRDAKIGLEVVSREGFGSLFPTLADLPNGIRLDPGLLPPEAGAKAVVASLKITDDFITAVRKKPPVWLTKPEKWLGDLGGMTDHALNAVDRLTSYLHKAAHDKADYAASLLAYNGAAADNPLPAWKHLDQVAISYEIDSQSQVTDLRAAATFKRRKVLLRDTPELQDESVDAAGYGSESDYEDEDDDEDAAPLRLKKYTVATGMAALRMAVRYGAEHSRALLEEQKWVVSGDSKRAAGVTTWAPYFELDYGDLAKSVGAKSQMDLSILVFDGAPNPINVPEKLPPASAKLRWGAIVIDATNNTSREKARYIANTRPLLAAAADSGGVGGLLLLVDSASKHPTGGDLVHGVIRVCGTLPALQAFHKRLTRHLYGDSYKASTQTMLTKNETTLRRGLLQARLFTRNLDLFRLMPRED